MVSYINIDNFERIMPGRPINSNKGTFGRVLNIAGCRQYIGAAFLSSITPLKTGAGLVTLSTDEAVIPIIASKASEITFLSLKGHSESLELMEALQSYDVISIGCGLGIDEETKKLVNTVLNTETNAKWVIDADALNIISALNIEKLPKYSVLTPHPKEMSRLMKVSVEEIKENREKYAVLCAKKYNSVILLKGYNTVVTDGNYVYINKTGNSALAKAGSGDVLTGIISGLIAQGISPYEAAIKGAYIHGLTGESASKDLSEYSVLASDLIDYLPKVIKTLSDKNNF